MIHSLRRRGRHDTNTAYFITQIAHASFSSLSGRSGGASNLFTMKKLTILFLTGFISSLMVCCHKEDSYDGRVVAEGYVRQLGLKPGIVPNASVVLYEVKTSGEPFAPIYFIPIDTAITDANGYYYMDTPVNKEQVIFEMGASAKNYTNSYKSLDATGLNRNAKAKHDIGLKPYSWVEVNVRNDLKQGNEAILVGPSNDQFPAFYKSSDGSQTFYRKIIGNANVQITYRIQKGFDYIYRESETKYVAAHDTVKFNINY
jgi:hypothetical protein